MKIFIGSSEDAKNIARFVRTCLENLEMDLEVVCWWEAFRTSHYTLEELLRQAEECDGGVFILNADDKIYLERDEEKESTYVPRDNVLVEAGIFYGKLGQNGTVLYRVGNVKRISDFDGVTRIDHDERKKGSIEDKLRDWVEGLGEKCRASRGQLLEKNVLLKSRKYIHENFTSEQRLHIKDGKYKYISNIRVMNFAGNLMINPEEAADLRHREISGTLSYNLMKILEETEAEFDLILTAPTEANFSDLTTKIANQRMGNSAGTVYSAWSRIFQNLKEDSIYKKAYIGKTKRFFVWAIKIGIPFAIFNVEFLGEYDKKYSHVKIDLYSAKIRNEDERRSFIIWKAEDEENYDFFVRNFDEIKNDTSLCFAPTLQELEQWDKEWKDKI